MNKRILVADDDASVRETLGRVLELERYDVVLAGTGREAIAKLRSAVPDLVLLDLNMPDQNGWQAFAAMSSAAPGVPVFIITAVPHQARRAAQLGAAALMEKPLDLPRLLEIVGDLLARAAVTRRVRAEGSHATIPILPAWTKTQPNCTGGAC
jgi:two-component system response regulator MprA